MAIETREMELKYEAAPGAALPPLQDLPQVAAVSDPETETLIAEYYDVDDLRLLRSGITLRRREGGADAGWHLKLPAGGKGTVRRELRVPLDRSGDPVPDDLARLVRIYTRGAGLRPVARIETRRQRCTLGDAEGNSLTEVVADEVAAQTLGTSTTLSRWNEIEVELTGGSQRLLRAVDRRLRKGGLHRVDRPKLARALASELLGRAGSQSIAGQSDSTRTIMRDSAGEVVLAYLRKQAEVFKSLDPGIRRDEPDSVHQMRVAARRLRSTLQSFPILPATVTGHLIEELRWIGRVLGEAREQEVLREYLKTELASTPAELMLGPAQARVSAHFAPREASARTAVLEAIDSPRYFAMVDDLDRLLADPPLTAAARPADEVIPAAVARAYRRTRRRMRRARHTPAGQTRDVALHRARKAAKRARYAAEVMGPPYGKRARRYLKRIKAVQSELGAHQDAVNARAAARDIGIRASLAGENAFTFGLLHERADRSAQDRRHRARRAWKRVSRRKWPR